MSANPIVTEHFEQGLVVRLFGNHRLEGGERSSSAAVADLHAQLARRDDAEGLAARLDRRAEQRLRAPIATIRTIAGVLQHQLAGAQARQAAAVGDAADRVDAMMVDLLAFVRASSCGLVPNRCRIDLKLVFERVVDAVSNAHPDRPIVFASDRAVQGNWDPDALQTLLTKLLVNAIEHGAPRPPVRVTVRSLPDVAVLDVWSPGAITDRDVKSSPFEPFRGRADSPYKPSSGLGLGLYLAREIVRAHGGSIELVSDEVEGTSVQARLPYA